MVSGHFNLIFSNDDAPARSRRGSDDVLVRFGRRWRVEAKQYSRRDRVLWRKVGISGRVGCSISGLSALWIVVSDYKEFECVCGGYLHKRNQIKFGGSSAIVEEVGLDLN